MLRAAWTRGARAALEKLGIAGGVPTPGAVGMNTKMLSAPGFPKPSATSMPAKSLKPLASNPVGNPAAAPTPAATGGLGGIPKIAFNAGLGSSNSSDGTGGVRGEPADTGRRQQSVIDRAWQQHDDMGASSSMPLPGDNVAP